MTDTAPIPCYFVFIGEGQHRGWGWIPASEFEGLVDGAQMVDPLELQAGCAPQGEADGDFLAALRPLPDGNPPQVRTDVIQRFFARQGPVGPHVVCDSCSFVFDDETDGRDFHSQPL